MQQTFDMLHLECAHCASKMEERIRKIQGVESATISFFTQKLSIDAPEDQIERIINEAKKICRKIEPDCTIKT